MDWRERLRSRWLALAAIAVVMIVLSPRPLPAPPLESLERARVALQYGQISAALDHLDAAMTFEPALDPLRTEAARLALEGGEPARALEILGEARFSLEDSKSAACIQTAAEVMLEPASQTYERLSDWLDACPDGIDRAAIVAIDLFESTDPSRSLPYLRALMAHNVAQPQILEAYALMLAAFEPWEAEPVLAGALVRGGNHLSLVQDLLTGLQDLGPETPRTVLWMQAGLILARHHEWPLARQAFERAAAEDPKNALATAYLGLSIDQLGGDGLPYLERAAASAPSDATVQLLLAMHWQGRGDPGNAQEALERAARLAPYDPAVAAQLGSVYAELGDLPAAAAAYRLAAELAPEEPRFWRLLAEFSLMHHYDLESIGKPAARNALALDPRDGRSWAALGQIHLLQEQMLLAQRCLYQAIVLDPLDAEIQLRYGMLQQVLGELRAARAAFELASRLDPQGKEGALAGRLLETLFP